MASHDLNNKNNYHLAGALMNTFLKTIYTGYRNIHLISHAGESIDRRIDALGKIDKQNICQINQADYLNTCLFNHQSADLVVIDVDSIGTCSTEFLLFLLRCFYPHCPVVLQGTLDKSQQDRYLASGVLEIVCGSDTAGMMVTSDAVQQ
ncbi:hypothetical protein AB833_07925 [Chromatiales bacterium (ex Bugula neritina AB1)]|nr:hypothetical protein AB833_07925 [Chromatiales bacterium (ex Bugula neritina AB1)]